MRKKLKDCGGMTFVEILCAVVILVLLCLLTSTGLNMALNSYVKLTAESETQLLMNSLMDAISDKLRYCVVTKDASGDYISSVGEVGLTPDGKVTMGGQELLPDGAYGNDGAWGTDLRYKVETVEVKPDYNGSRPVFTIKIKVKGAPAATEGIDAMTEDFTVQCLNPLKTES